MRTPRGAAFSFHRLCEFRLEVLGEPGWVGAGWGVFLGEWHQVKKELLARIKI